MGYRGEECYIRLLKINFTTDSKNKKTNKQTKSQKGALFFFT